jgi:hypothetical protein
MVVCHGENRLKKEFCGEGKMNGAFDVSHHDDWSFWRIDKYVFFCCINGVLICPRSAICLFCNLRAPSGERGREKKIRPTVYGSKEFTLLYFF